MTGPGFNLIVKKTFYSDPSCDFCISRSGKTPCIRWLNRPGANHMDPIGQFKCTQASSLAERTIGFVHGNTSNKKSWEFSALWVKIK